MTVDKKKLKVEWVAVDKIKVYENNPKEHPLDQVAKIVNSIENFGFTVPIVVDGENTIIMGHGRLLAAQELDMEKVPVIKRDDLDKAQIKLLRIADNKVTESGWDVDALKAELSEIEISFPEIDLDLSGFGEGERNILFKNYGSVFSYEDAESEWDGMPEFNQEDATAWKTLKVHFANEEDYKKFQKLIDQKLTEKTLFIWFPEQERESTLDKGYIADES